MAIFPWFLLRFQKFSAELKKPESKAIFIETNNLAERWSEIVYFLFVKLIFPLFMLPKFMTSLIIYLLNDFENDALDLPFVMS